MRVIGTVGLAGSGKGEAAEVAAEAGVPVVTMGDVIRQECRDRGLDPAEHHGEIAKTLREENGPAAVAERSLPMIRDELDDADLVLVDGLRSAVEAERFEAAFGDEFVLVAVEAPFEVRADRLAARGRDASDADRERLRERDAREREFGVEALMDRADVRVENTGTLSEFRRTVRRLLADGPESLAER
jgi:dephospho-CoA kinase